MRPEVRLPGIGCAYSLPVTLPLVEVLEKHAPVMKTAERLVAREMRLAEIMEMLRGCYSFAGCDTPRDALDAFLLGQSPALLLAEILCAVLGPAQSMGAITAGQDNRRIDITSLRRFFLGVLGWTPDTLKKAALPDLCDAYLGHAQWHGIAPKAPPGKEFMTAMLQQFPDGKDKT